MTRATRLAVALLGLVMPAAAAEGPDVSDPTQPFPGNPRTIPYERVLDRSRVVLVGEVKAITANTVEIGVRKVLRGEFKKETARISYHGSWSGAIGSLTCPKVGALGTFMCLTDRDGEPVLAGNPPKGGGFVEEGAELAAHLLEAAADPVKGFESKSPAVRLSSAYRLAQAWIAAPADAKPTVPPGLVDALVECLVPDALRGRHVNAAGRDCIDTIFKCSINRIWKYSVNHGEAERKAAAEEIADAWRRTVKAVRARRGEGEGQAPRPEVDADKLRKTAGELVAKLGSEEFAERDAADRALRTMGEPALAALKAGVASKDVEVSDRCRDILRFLGERARQPELVEGRFDLDLAEPFVPPARAAKRPEAGAGG